MTGERLIRKASTFTGSAQIHDVEALAEPILPESEHLGHSGAPLPQDALQLIAHVPCLRGMSMQGSDLAAEGVRDVHGVGHLRMGHDPDLADMPRLQSALDELGPGVA